MGRHGKCADPTGNLSISSTIEEDVGDMMPLYITALNHWDCYRHLISVNRAFFRALTQGEGLRVAKRHFCTHGYFTESMWPNKVWEGTLQLYWKQNNPPAILHFSRGKFVKQQNKI